MLAHDRDWSLARALLQSYGSQPSEARLVEPDADGLRGGRDPDRPPLPRPEPLVHARRGVETASSGEVRWNGATPSVD